MLNVMSNLNFLVTISSINNNHVMNKYLNCLPNHLNCLSRLQNEMFKKE